MIDVGARFMNAHFSISKRVEFADTDAAGIMHFANFFRFMEVCEHAFFRSLDLSVHTGGGDERGEGEAEVGWPRVHVSCDFKQALKFEDSVEIELVIKELGSKTILYEFCFWKDAQNEEQRTLAATGKFTVICVCWSGDDGKMKAVEIPQQIRKKMEQAISV